MGVRERNRLGWSAQGARFNFGDGGSVFDATPEERRAKWDAAWEMGGPALLYSYNDLSVNKQANELVAEYVRDKIREIVHDPETAELLCPHNVLGCKRICFDNGYFETYNRPSVHLVDVSSTPIEITAAGPRVGEQDYPVDAIVFATGYDAMTGSLLAIDIRGRGGLTLREQWHAGPITYLGLGVPGFPNLFTVSGPGSPSVLTNMVTSIEQHVEWISDCIDYVGTNGFRTIEATEQAARDWVLHVNQVAGQTLYYECNSWYLGANIPGKTRMFMPLFGFPPYVERCNEVVAKGYEGFELTRAAS